MDLENGRSTSDRYHRRWGDLHSCRSRAALLNWQLPTQTFPEKVRNPKSTCFSVLTRFSTVTSRPRYNIWVRGGGEMVNGWFNSLTCWCARTTPWESGKSYKRSKKVCRRNPQQLQLCKWGLAHIAWSHAVERMNATVRWICIPRILLTWLIASKQGKKYIEYDWVLIHTAEKWLSKATIRHEQIEISGLDLGATKQKPLINVKKKKRVGEFRGDIGIQR